MKEFGGKPGRSYDATWWSAVEALYEEAFPGLPARIALASGFGTSWAEITTPFAVFEGPRCVAHVGVITHPMKLNGERVEIAGIHAVCTAADRRRQGLCRRTLAAALSWADQRHAMAKLHTNEPAVYTGHGFVATPTWRFRASTRQRVETASRPLDLLRDPSDREILKRLLRERTPVSNHCATADPGWVVTIDAALSGRLDALRYLPEHDAVVCLDREPDQVLIVEVIAATLPPPEVVLGLCGDAPAIWSFTPDLHDPGAEPEPAPASTGTFMTRDHWPPLAPFGISPLWEH